MLRAALVIDQGCFCLKICCPKKQAAKIANKTLAEGLIKTLVKG